MGHFLEQSALQIVQAAGLRNDAASVAGFLRDLTYVYQQTYDIKYMTAVARTFIPVDNRVNPGAESFVWRQYDRVGTAKFIDMQSEDLPSVDVFGLEYQGRVASLGISYSYTYQDMRAAQMMGLPLETRKAEAARRAMENAVEAVAAFGDAGANLLDPALRGGLVGSLPLAGDGIRMYGLANMPGSINASAYVTTKSGSTLQTGTDWTNGATSVGAIVDDFNAMIKAMLTVTLGVHRPDTLCLPTAIWVKLMTAARSSTFTTDTILSYLRTLQPSLKQVIYWPMLDLAGLKQDNATAGPRILLLETNPENFQLVIPQEFEQMPPQFVNMAIKIPCHSRIGGVKAPYPKSICYLDGAAG